MQNEIIPTFVTLDIGGCSYGKIFEAKNDRELRKMLWNYMIEEKKILYVNFLVLLDKTKAVQIGFLNKEGNEDETEFDTWDQEELEELFWDFLLECRILEAEKLTDEWYEDEPEGEDTKPTDLDCLTISRKDVLNTVETFYQQGLKPEVMDVVLDFASELTGMSVDAINNLI